MVWTEVLELEEENGRARLAAKILASDAYQTTMAKVRAFVSGAAKRPVRAIHHPSPRPAMHLRRRPEYEPPIDDGIHSNRARCRMQTKISLLNDALTWLCQRVLIDPIGTRLTRSMKAWSSTPAFRPRNAGVSF
jgi:hypothetical protein